MFMVIPHLTRQAIILGQLTIGWSCVSKLGLRYSVLTATEIHAADNDQNEAYPLHRCAETESLPASFLRS